MHGEGSRGGIVVGHTPTGKPIYASERGQQANRMRGRAANHEPSQREVERKKLQEANARFKEFEQTAEARKKERGTLDPRKRKEATSIHNVREGDIVRIARKGRGRTFRGNLGKVVGRDGENVKVLLPYGSTHDFPISDLEFAKSDLASKLAFIREFSKSRPAGANRKLRNVKQKSKKGGVKTKQVWFVKGPDGKWKREKTGRNPKAADDDKTRQTAEPEQNTQRKKGNDSETKKMYGKGGKPGFLKENEADFKRVVGGTHKNLEIALGEYERAKDRYDAAFADPSKIPDSELKKKQFQAVRFVYERLNQNAGSDEQGLARTAGGTQESDAGNGSDNGRGQGGGKRKKEQSQQPKIVTQREGLTPHVDVSRVPREWHEKKVDNKGVIGAALGDHQKIGVAAMLQSVDNGKEFLLGDGTGCGKTRQLLVFAAALAEEKKKPVLIVTQNQKIIQGNIKNDAAPLGININTDLSKIHGGQTGGVTYCTYDDIRLGKVKLEKGADGENPLASIIFDEAHTIKNQKSGLPAKSLSNIKQSGRAVHAFDLKQYSDHTVFSTATPLDKTDNIFYLSSVLGMKPLQLATQMGYSLTQDKNGRPKLVKNKPPMTVEEKNEMINALFDGLTQGGGMLQREAQNPHGAELNVQNVPLRDEDRAELEQYGEKYIGKNGSTGRAAMMQRRMIEKFKIKTATDKTAKELKAGKQVIIYFENVTGSVGGGRSSSLEQLKAHFSAQEIPFEAITGGGSKKQTAAAVDNFQSGKSKVILVQNQFSAGISLDDTTGNAPRHMIVMTPSLSASEEVQRLGRNNRVSTRSKAEVTYLTTDHNADAWNLSILQPKFATLGASVKGVPQSVDLAGQHAKSLAQGNEETEEVQKSSATMVPSHEVPEEIAAFEHDRFYEP